MATARIKRTPPEPSTIRTDRDWVMMVLGAGLILLFLIGGYLSVPPSETPSIPKMRGPVKDPEKLGFLEPYGRHQTGNPASPTDLVVDDANRGKPAV